MSGLDEQREPGWVRSFLRLVLGPESGAEVAHDLRDARPPALGPLRTHLWYARQLAHPDILRLARLVRDPRRGSGDPSSGGVLARWRRDLRDARRSLRRGAIFPLLCLTVGIGLTGAAFGALHSVLLAPLPFPDGDRLVVLRRDLGDGSGSRALTWMDLGIVRDDPGIEGAEAWDTRSYTLQGTSGAEHVSGATVTPGLLPLLGIEPALGRTFAPGEGAEAGFEEVVVLGHDLWTRRFGADPTAVGRTLVVNERPMTIVGVLPAGVAFPSGQELWLPLGTDVPDDPDRRYLSAVARIGSGPATDGLAPRLARAARDRARGSPAPDDGGFLLSPLRDAFVPEPARRFLPLMLGAVVLVLLIACANVANLLLVRARAREGEMAVRVAIGARRTDLARLVLAETALLAGAGGLLGTGLAWAWLRILQGRLPDGLPYWTRLELDPAAVAVAVAVTIGAALLSASAPVARTTVRAPSSRLRAARSAGTGRAGRVVAAAELALCFVLVVSAALLGRSFLALTRTDAGFETGGVASFRLTLSGDSYDVVPARLDLVDRVLAGLEGPASGPAAASTALPSIDYGSTRTVGAPDRPGETTTAALVGVSAGFFDLLGATPVRGRFPTASEAHDPEAAVAVVDEGLATRFWPDGDALGRTLEVERHGTVRIIGVARPLRYGPPGEADPDRHQVHVPYARLPSRGLAFMARSPGAPIAAREIRAAVADGDPSQAPFDARSLAERHRLATAHERLFLKLSAEFGLAALLLALAGIYGVSAHGVARRARELGIRRALGSSRRRVVGGVVGEAVALGVAGIAVGLAGVAAAAPALSRVLYGIGPADPASLAATAALMLLTALAAAAVPAARAARANPAEVLGSE